MYANSIQTFETLPFEAEVVAAPPPPTSRQYLCWAQRSLSRHGWGTPTDGADSLAYRDAVRAFAREHMGRTAPSGDVDPATQDALIRLNHVHPDYTAWTQRVLVGSGPHARFARCPPRGLSVASGGRAPLTGLLSAAASRAEPIMDRTTSATQAALRKLQGKHGLLPNGWVGSKTELVLMKLSASVPPGADGKPQPCSGRRPPPPPPKKKDDVDEVVIRLLKDVDVPTLVDDDFLRDEVACLKRFILDALAGQRLDDRYWQFTPLDSLGRERSCDYRFEVLSAKRHTKPQHAVANFRRCAKGARTADDAARCLLQVHRAIRCHVNALKNVLTHQAGNTDISCWTECAWMLELRAASERKAPASVYRCFGAFIRNASSQC